MRHPSLWLSSLLWIFLLESVWLGNQYEEQTRVALIAPPPHPPTPSLAQQGIFRAQEAELSSECHVAHEDTISQVKRGASGEEKGAAW